MRVTVVFDVEDYLSPATAGLDDLLGMLAEVMTEQRISGTFFLIGEKVRCLRERGRQDVFAALRRHDLGSHTNMGSIHPTVAERTEHADWANGVARMLADELAAVDELSGIVGRELRSYARHGGSWSPHLVAALATRGLPFVYSHARLPRHNVTWYCNTLNFHGCMQVFQECYRSHQALAAAELKFGAFAEEHRDWDWLGVFNSHPCMIKTEWFWDRNYFKGLNPPPAEWVAPACSPDYDLATVREVWGVHAAHLRDDPRYQVGTISDFAAEFGSQAAAAGADELQALAKAAAEQETPTCTDRFSAGEIVDLLARAWLHLAATGALPEQLERRAVLGPTQLPLAVPTARQMTPEAVSRVARGIATAVGLGGLLPSELRCGEGTLGSAGVIGLGSALRLLGEAVATGGKASSYRPRVAAPYPAAGDAIVADFKIYVKWPCHRLDLDTASLCRLSALQAWTLKPAWPGEVPAFRA